MPPVDFQVGGADRARSALVSTAVPSGIGAIAQGVHKWENFLREKQAEDQEHRDRLRSVELQGQATRRLIDGHASLDPTADDYLEQVEELVRSTQAEIMAEPGIRSDSVLQDLEEQIAKQAQATLSSAVATRHQKIEEKSLALLDEHADEAFAQIRQDPDGFDAYVVGLYSIAEQLGPSIRPDVLDERMRVLGDNAFLAKIEGLALAGRYEEAQAYHREVEGELSPAKARDAARLIREIENRHRNDFLAATDGMVADLNIAIIDATSVSELSALRERVEQAAADGLFESREQSRVSLIRAIEAKRQRLVKDSQDLAVALGKLHSGTGNDDQDEADLAYGAVSSRYPEGLDQASRDALDREFIKKSGWVPTVLKREIENAERVENPEMLARAAQRAQAINDVAPGVKTGAGERSILTQTYHELGLPWDEAAQLVIDRAPDNATLAARGKEFDEEFKDQDWREFLRDADLAGGGFSPGLAVPGMTIIGGPILLPRLFEPDAEIPEEVVQATERAVRHFYKLSGDFEAATAAAVKRLSEVYGITNAGGPPRLQKYPPERYIDIGTHDPRSEHFADDERLRAEALDGLVRRAVEATGAGVPDQYALVSDRETQRRVEAGLKPDYEVRVPAKTGDVMVPVWVETEAGVRTKLRITMPTKETAMSLPEVQAAERESRLEALAAADRRAALRAVGFGASQLAEIGASAAGAAITAVPRAIGEASMEAVRRHPYRGFLARNRERRKQRRRERGE